MSAQIADFEDACALLGIRPDDVLESVGLHGHGWWELRDEDGALKELGVFSNLITDVGDEYYMERAAGIASPPNQVSGMRLGTGTTAVAKTGAGAAIVTYTTGLTASKAIDGGFPTSSQPGGAGTARRIQWKTSWAAGEATQNNMAEAVITNQATLSDTAGTAADTIARALLSPTVSKGAGDTFALTWNHDGLGA